RAIVAVQAQQLLKQAAHWHVAVDDRDLELRDQGPAWPPDLYLRRVVGHRGHSRRCVALAQQRDVFALAVAAEVAHGQTTVKVKVSAAVTPPIVHVTST